MQELHQPDWFFGCLARIRRECGSSTGTNVELDLVPTLPSDQARTWKPDLTRAYVGFRVRLWVRGTGQVHNKPQHLNNTGLEPHLTFVQHHNCSSRQHNILQGLRQHRDTEPQRGCLCNVLVSALQARPARVIEALTGPDGLVCKRSGNGAARRNGTHDLQPRPLPDPLRNTNPPRAACSKL